LSSFIYPFNDEFTRREAAGVERLVICFIQFVGRLDQSESQSNSRLNFLILALIPFCPELTTSNNEILNDKYRETS